MNEEQKPKKGSMAFIKMPSEHMGFIKKNPKIAKKAGILVVGLIEYNRQIDKIKSLLGQTDKFSDDLEEGTIEELEAFLKTLTETERGGVITDLPEGAEELVLEKLGEKGGEVIKTVIG